MNSKFIDFTGGNLLPGAYSYQRPAWIIGNAFINGFITAGLTPKQAINLFYSKAIRWAYDFDLEDRLEKLIFNKAQKMVREYQHEPWLNESLSRDLKKELDLIIKLSR